MSAGLSIHVVGDDELSEEQINTLLAQATVRLEEKAHTKLLSAQQDAAIRYNIPKLDAGISTETVITSDGVLSKTRHHLQKEDNGLKGFRKVEDPVAAKALTQEQKKATAGPMWYDLPKTNLTPELKRDLQLLKMRGVLDPQRHYKKENGKMAAPEFSMIGTITEGATEYYTGRIENKKRKQTFVEEVLSGEKENGRFKKKYGDVQAKKSSGKKAFYKALQAKRHHGVKKGG